MQSRYDKLRELLSEPRTRPYGPDGDDGVRFSRYLSNVALCEALYPSLHFFEVCLRNRMHLVLSFVTGSERWMFPGTVLLRTQEQVRVSSAMDRLSSKGKQATPDRIIAELSLGFWVDLFVRHYEMSIWRTQLHRAFPFIPRKVRTRDHVYGTLDSVRRIRNRAFHHEPIWHYPDLAESYDKVRAVLGWIDPMLPVVLAIIDRFDPTQTADLSIYRDLLVSRLS